MKSQRNKCHSWEIHTVLRNMWVVPFQMCFRQCLSKRTEKERTVWTLTGQKEQAPECMKTTSVSLITTHLHTQTHACAHNQRHCGFNWTNSGLSLTCSHLVQWSRDVKSPSALLFCLCYFYSLVAVGKQAALCRWFAPETLKLPKHHQNPPLQAAAQG